MTARPTPPLPFWSIAAVVPRIAGQLQKAGRDEYGRLAELLVAHLTGIPRLELPLHRRALLAPRLRSRLRRGVARLAAGLPWQYFTGTTVFLDRTFHCDRRALIPRPETEILADWIINDIHRNGLPPARIMDVGTGSGCILITLLAELPASLGTAIDISRPALMLARKNALRLGVAGRIRFVRADLRQGLPSARTVDLLVSNPPYVTAAEWRRLPAHIREYEPASALLAGPDGLAYAPRLVIEARKILNPGGRLYMEIAPRLVATVCRHMQTAGFIDITTNNDYHGRAHFVRARRPHGGDLNP